MYIYIYIKTSKFKTLVHTYTNIQVVDNIHTARSRLSLSLIPMPHPRSFWATSFFTAGFANSPEFANQMLVK